MTTKFLAISIALASILPTHAIADDKTGPSHPLGGGMNPNDGVCTSHDWGAEVIICTGSKGNWSCLPRGDWACYADDVVWSTDCPSCSRPSDDEVGRIQDEPKTTGDCRWGDPARMQPQLIWKRGRSTSVSMVKMRRSAWMPAGGASSSRSV